MPNEAWFDGSCEPFNPGGTAKAGFLIRTSSEKRTGSQIVGSGQGMTNNIAEYAALLGAFHLIEESGRTTETWTIYSDSILVVNMVNEIWGKKQPHKKAPHLLPYLLECRRLFKKLKAVTLRWIPREENLEADTLSK